MVDYVESGEIAPEELARMKRVVAEFEKLHLVAAMVVIKGAMYTFTRVAGEFRVARQALP